MRTWLLAVVLLCAGPSFAQTQPPVPVHDPAADDAAARFDRMSDQEKEALRERLREYKALPLDEQFRIQANPERRKQMMENLRQWRKMTREQREQMRQRLREMRERRPR